MFVLGSSIVDWSAIWKICLVALAAGAGTVVIFGFMLLGLKFAGSSGADGTQSGSRVGGLAVAVLCRGICIGIIVLGIYAMTQK